MSSEQPIREGETAASARTFTTEDVSAFADLSNDEGSHHVASDEHDRVVVHGLFTTTMPTKLGGDIDFVARTMEFEFPNPAYTGVEITCTATYDAVEERNGHIELTASFRCATPDGTVVLRGQSDGIVSS